MHTCITLILAYNFIGQGDWSILSDMDGNEN